MTTGIFQAAVSSYPQNPSTPVWVTILIAFTSLIGGGLGFQVYKRWRTGQTEDAVMISNAALEQARNAKDLFVEYRIELEESKKQVAIYLAELIQVNRLLGEANARIARLEEELRIAHTEHRELRDRLDQAKRERDETMQVRERLIQQVAKLQEQIRDLETSYSNTLRREVT